jgi:hypothetical protein
MVLIIPAVAHQITIKNMLCVRVTAVLGHHRGASLEQGDLVLQLFPESAPGYGNPALLTSQIQEARKGSGQGEQEIVQLSRPNGKLENPQATDQVVDSSWGRKIYLRRQAAKSRVTIFEGGHEGIAEAAVAWLEGHVKAR